MHTNKNGKVDFGYEKKKLLAMQNGKAYFCIISSILFSCKGKTELFLLRSWCLGLAKIS